MWTAMRAPTVTRATFSLKWQLPCRGRAGVPRPTGTSVAPPHAKARLRTAGTVAPRGRGNHGGGDELSDDAAGGPGPGQPDPAETGGERRERRDGREGALGA